jgi:hypothetical protein
MTDATNVAPKMTRDEFLSQHAAGKTDRDLLEDIAYHTYVYGQKVIDVSRKIDALDAYVHQIETEAHEAMSGMMNPAKMAEMAQEFLK